MKSNFIMELDLHDFIERPLSEGTIVNLEGFANEFDTIALFFTGSTI